MRRGPLNLSYVDQRAQPCNESCPSTIALWIVKKDTFGSVMHRVVADCPLMNCISDTLAQHFLIESAALAVWIDVIKGEVNPRQRFAA